MNDYHLVVAYCGQVRLLLFGALFSVFTKMVVLFLVLSRLSRNLFSEIPLDVAWDAASLSMQLAHTNGAVYFLMSPSVRQTKDCG